MTTLANDPFTRVTAAGFGIEPISGQTYALSTTAAQYATTGTVGRITTVTTGASYYATLNVSSQDHTVRVTETLPVLPLGAAVSLRAVGRWSDAGNYYEALLLVAITTGAATLTIQKRVAGAASVALSSAVAVGTHVAGNAWTIVLSVWGTAVRARAFNASTGVDPLTFQVSAVDTSGQPPPGSSAGMGCRREGGNTNGSVDIDFDNFTVDTLLTVAPQVVWPPRNLVTVSSLQVGDSVVLYRLRSGVRTLVQAGQVAATTDVAVVRVDAQLPFGAPISYVASINGVETSTTAVTYTLPGGKVALSDAIGGTSAEAVILSWPEKAYARNASTFRVGGRNVAVLGDLGQFESTIELYAATTSIRDSIVDLVRNATQGVIQIRQPGGYDGVDCYVAVLGVREPRWSQDGSDPRRRLLLDVAETGGWAAALTATGFTYADVTTAYTGLTYANLAADYLTYLAMSQGNYS